MGRRLEDLRKDLKQGVRTLVQTTGELGRDVMTESSKIGIRLQINRLEYQLESCFREIGRRAFPPLSSGATDLSLDPEIRRLIEEANQLVKEQERLRAGMSEEEGDDPFEGVGDH